MGNVQRNVSEKKLNNSLKKFLWQKVSETIKQKMKKSECLSNTEREREKGEWHSLLRQRSVH